METFARTFPDGFLWGAATASYQIEGARRRGRSHALHLGHASRTPPARSRTATPATWPATTTIAMPEDVALVRDLGLDAYRFSVAWPRVLPDGHRRRQPGRHRLLLAARRHPARGRHPPRGHALPLGPAAGARRTRAAGRPGTSRAGTPTTRPPSPRALGDRVTHWTTLNEPWCSSVLELRDRSPRPRAPRPARGHGGGPPPPARPRVGRARHPRARSGRRGLDHAQPDAGVATEDGDDRDADAVRRADDALNGLFFDPLFHGAYPAGFARGRPRTSPTASFIHDGDLATISTPARLPRRQQLLPHPRRAARDGERATPRCPGATVWSRSTPARRSRTWAGRVDPRASRLIIERSARECGLPVYVTENGSAWPDTVSTTGGCTTPSGSPTCEAHLGAVADAIDGGVDVRGYFAWSPPRQLRVGLRVRQALRHRPRRLRHPGAHGEGLRPRVRPNRRGAP